MLGSCIAAGSMMTKAIHTSKHPAKRGAQSKAVRVRAKLGVELSSFVNAQTTNAQGNPWPARPPVWDRMPDPYWEWLRDQFDLPEITVDGCDVRSYLENWRAKLRESRALEHRQPPLRMIRNDLMRIVEVGIGGRMPRLRPALAARLAGMGMLDRRFGAQDPATLRGILSYILAQERVTEPIHEWAAWILHLGGASRTHIRLHGGTSSLAEVSATSELINFTRHVLREPDSNWVGESTSAKHQVGSGRRAKIEVTYRTIAGRQTRLVRALLHLAGVRDPNGFPLKLPQVRQRIERCRTKIAEGEAAGYLPNALWEFLEKRTPLQRTDAAR